MPISCCSYLPQRLVRRRLPDTMLSSLAAAIHARSR